MLPGSTLHHVTSPSTGNSQVVSEESELGFRGSNLTLCVTLSAIWQPYSAMGVKKQRTWGRTDKAVAKRGVN